MTPSRKRPLFPLIRHMSGPVTAVLVRFPVSANQITTASLVSGLAASWYLVEGKFDAVVTAAVLLLVSYVLDYCDGEIARIKGQCSEFGDKFDTFVDWIVHTAFFVALGIGATRSFGANVWFWLGVIAGIGGTINYFIGIMLDARGKAVPETAKPGTHLPESARDRMLYAFRELTRWDFCFIILVLAVFDLAWVLLPVGAIGAQIYWITQFARGAHDFHTLEHFPPGLNRSDRAISGRGQESAAERSGTTVKGLDAASARKGLSLRDAGRRASAALSRSPPGVSGGHPRAPRVPHRASWDACRSASPTGHQSGSIWVENALVPAPPHPRQDPTACGT